MKKLFPIFLLLFFSSCVTNYYYVSLIEDTTLYKDQSYDSPVIVMPKDTQVFVSGTDTYKKIKYGKYKGWAYNPKYSYAESNNNYRSGNSSRKYSSPSNSSKTVHVKGYTRKDGTYVKPHTRSAPKTKG